jgi:hypothetical protein
LANKPLALAGKKGEAGRAPKGKLDRPDNRAALWTTLLDSYIQQHNLRPRKYRLGGCESKVFDGDSDFFRSFRPMVRATTCVCN